jgi:hypothetical protein
MTRSRSSCDRVVVVIRERRVLKPEQNVAAEQRPAEAGLR